MMKEDKILEFRERFDAATQKLVNKDEILQNTRLEKDKIEAQFQKIKESMIQEGLISQDGEEVTENLIKKGKNQWIKRREKEEKSFIDANDYIQVCKRLKEVKSENEIILNELKGYKDQVQCLNSELNSIKVRNENLERKAGTHDKVIQQLKDQKLDIQYRADKKLEGIQHKYENELNRSLMILEDQNMRILLNQEYAEKLEKLISEKEADEQLQNETISMLEFNNKVLENRVASLEEKQEDMGVKYDNLNTENNNLLEIIEKSNTDIEENINKISNPLLLIP